MSRMISIRIPYDHRSSVVSLLVLALLVLALFSYLVWEEGAVTASAPQALTVASVNIRQYYLTKTTHNGTAALSACQKDYHMASLWEIFDPSALKYNTSLGYTKDDSGQGPPTSTPRSVGGCAPVITAMPLTIPVRATATSGPATVPTTGVRKSACLWIGV